MQLSQEDYDLVINEPNAFRIKAYLQRKGYTSVRVMARHLGLKPSYCYKQRKRFAPNAVVKPTPAAPQASKAQKTEQEQLTGQMRSVFEQHYRQVTQLEFYWEAKQVQALKALERKIAKGMRDKGLEVTAQSLCESFAMLLGIIDDPWLLKNLSPSIINSKYNEIRTAYQQRNNPNTRRSRQDDAKHNRTELLNLKEQLREHL